MSAYCYRDAQPFVYAGQYQQAPPVYSVNNQIPLYQQTNYAPPAEEVVVQTTTTQYVENQVPSLSQRISVSWHPRHKLYLSTFKRYYPIAISNYIDFNEFRMIIEECNKRFRSVIKPWRTFWSRQKKLVPVEIFAAVATFGLSMFVSVPVWYHGYGKARKRAEYEEAMFRSWIHDMNRDHYIKRGFQLKLCRSNKRILRGGKYELENVELVFEIF